MSPRVSTDELLERLQHARSKGGDWGLMILSAQDDRAITNRQADELFAAMRRTA